jgi:uncharacterized protein (DUF2225 family)
METSNFYKFFFFERSENKKHSHISQFCSENASCLFSNKFITLTLTSFETRLQTEMQKKVGYKHSGPYISSQVVCPNSFN